MRHFTCDLDRRKLCPDETTLLKVSGPLAYMVGRRELHLSKPAAAALARWLGHPVNRPELEAIEGPNGHIAPEADADATAADLAALRVESLAKGTPAHSRPPKGRRKTAG